MGKSILNKTLTMHRIIWIKRIVLCSSILLLLFSSLSSDDYEDQIVQYECDSIKYDYTRRILTQNTKDTSKYFIIVKNDSFIFAIKDFKFGRNFTAKDSQDFISFMSQITAYVTIDEMKSIPNQKYPISHDFFSHKPNRFYVDSMLALENELSEKARGKLDYVLSSIKVSSVFWFYPLSFPDVCYFELNKKSCQKLRVENTISHDNRCKNRINKSRFYIDGYCYFLKRQAMTRGGGYSELKEW